MKQASPAESNGSMDNINQNMVRFLCNGLQQASDWFFAETWLVISELLPPVYFANISRCQENYGCIH